MLKFSSTDRTIFVVENIRPSLSFVKIISNFFYGHLDQLEIDPNSSLRSKILKTRTTIINHLGLEIFRYHYDARNNTKVL